MSPKYNKAGVLLRGEKAESHRNMQGRWVSGNETDHAGEVKDAQAEVVKGQKETPEGAWPYWSLDWCPLNFERIDSCSLKPPSLWYFAMAAPVK